METGEMPVKGTAEETLWEVPEGTEVSRGGKLLGERDNRGLVLFVVAVVVVAGGGGSVATGCFWTIDVVVVVVVAAGWRPSSSSQRWVDRFDACRSVLIHSWAC
jgi:hypothetical protein